MVRFAGWNCHSFYPQFELKVDYTNGRGQTPRADAPSSVPDVDLENEPVLNCRLAWVMLKCIDLFDDMIEELPWTKKDLQEEADKVGSTAFFWVGQLATPEQMNELQMKAISKRYVRCLACRASCCLA